MSPSFRALAEELDDPETRPTETQLRQIERELDQIPGAGSQATQKYIQKISLNNFWFVNRIIITAIFVYHVYINLLTVNPILS